MEQFQLQQAEGAARPFTGSTHLPTAVTQRCPTGCQWDLHSGSSAGADPFCPARAQHSFSHDARHNSNKWIWSSSSLNTAVSQLKGNK